MPQGVETQGEEASRGEQGYANFETDAAAVAVPDVTSLTVQLPCQSQRQQQELHHAARPGRSRPSGCQEQLRSDSPSEPLPSQSCSQSYSCFRLLVATIG